MPKGRWCIEASTEWLSLFPTILSHKSFLQVFRTRALFSSGSFAKETPVDNAPSVAGGLVRMIMQF